MGSLPRGLKIWQWTRKSAKKIAVNAHRVGLTVLAIVLARLLIRFFGL